MKVWLDSAGYWNARLGRVHRRGRVLALVLLDLLNDLSVAHARAQINLLPRVLKSAYAANPAAAAVAVAMGLAIDKVRSVDAVYEEKYFWTGVKELLFKSLSGGQRRNLRALLSGGPDVGSSSFRAVGNTVLMGALARAMVSAFDFGLRRRVQFSSRMDDVGRAYYKNTLNFGEVVGEAEARAEAFRAPRRAVPLGTLRSSSAYQQLLAEYAAAQPLDMRPVRVSED